MEGTQELVSYALKIDPALWINKDFAHLSMSARVGWLHLLSLVGFWTPIKDEHGVIAGLKQHDTDALIAARFIVGKLGDYRIPPVDFVTPVLVAEIERSAMTSSLRKQILERDHHQCRLCGATADLHVDHLWPVSKGGRSEPVNLWVLCSRCNLWKSNKTLADWLEEVEAADIRGDIKVGGMTWESVVTACGFAWKRAEQLGLTG